MTHCAFCILALLVASSAAAQTNPCTASPTQMVYFTSTAVTPKIAVQLDDFNALLSTGMTTVPLWDTLEFGLQPQSTPTATPVVSFTIARATLTLAPGTADCYQGTPASVLSLPSGTPQVLVSRKVRASIEPFTSAWGSPSNPFAPLPALLPPGAVRVSK